jgi:hypothetical protein
MIHLNTSIARGENLVSMGRASLHGEVMDMRPPSRQDD